MTTRAASRTARRGRERAAEGKTKARMLRGRSRRTIQMVTGPLGGATTGRAAYGELSCGVRRTAVPRRAVPRSATGRAAFGDGPCRVRRTAVPRTATCRAAGRVGEALRLELSSGRHSGARGAGEAEEERAYPGQ